MGLTFFKPNVSSHLAGEMGSGFIISSLEEQSCVGGSRLCRLD